MSTPVDVAGAGALVVVAAEVAADGAAEDVLAADVLAGTVVVAAVEVVADPPEVVLGVHPASAAASARSWSHGWTLLSCGLAVRELRRARTLGREQDSRSPASRR
jgi:hypothetical protein